MSGPVIIGDGRGAGMGQIGGMLATGLDGHEPAWPGWGERSRLLDLLPGIFGSGDEAEFLGRYLRIYETILDQYERLLDGLPDRFDASVAPESFLPWLASWVGLVLEEGWPVGRRRAVLARAMELHRRRGTIRGLREHLALYTGYEPEIVEGGGSLALDRGTRLGEQTVLGQGDRAYHFSVVLRVPEPASFDRARLRVIIEAQRPAHTTYSLFVLLETATPTGGRQ